MDTRKHSSKAVSEWAKDNNEKNAKKAARAAPVIDFENLNIEDDMKKAQNVDALGNALNANVEIEVKQVLTKEQKELVALEAKVPNPRLDPSPDPDPNPESRFNPEYKFVRWQRNLRRMAHQKVGRPPKTS